MKKIVTMQAGSNKSREAAQKNTATEKAGRLSSRDAVLKATATTKVPLKNDLPKKADHQRKAAQQAQVLKTTKF